jgi:hypothetical protein
MTSEALWECASTIPGITYLPLPSMTRAPAGTATLAPTAAIFPSRITTVPREIVPFEAVMIVALVIATRRPAGGVGYESNRAVSRDAAGCCAVTGRAAATSAAASIIGVILMVSALR